LPSQQKANYLTKKRTMCVCVCVSLSTPVRVERLGVVALPHAPHHPPSAAASGLTAAPRRRGRKGCGERRCLAAPVRPLHLSEPRLSATATLLTLAHSSKRCEKRLGSACRSHRCACTGRTAPLASPQVPRTLPGPGVLGCMTESACPEVSTSTCPR
jgi:hypothetical protein